MSHSRSDATRQPQQQQPVSRASNSDSSASDSSSTLHQTHTQTYSDGYIQTTVCPTNNKHITIQQPITYNNTQSHNKQQNNIH
jgi:hypothetical protein